MKEWEKELDEIRALNAESARWRVESDKWRVESDKWRAESDKWRVEIDKWRVESDKRHVESDKRREESDKWRVESEKLGADFDKRLEEAWKWLEDYKKENKEAFAELRKNIFGISSSNGMVAEDYFYDSVDKTKVFGGNHFDLVRRNLNSKCKGEDGKECKMELDILLTNAIAVCMIEAKYRARKEDVSELAGDKVEKFRKLFPEYANHKLYLGLAAMSFEKGVEAEAKALGIGILKANGDAVEIDDANLKAY